MNRVTFSDEQSRPGSRQLQSQSSAMTRLIQKLSFGLIQTNAQANLFKLGVIGVGVLWFLGGVLLSGSSETIAPPAPELINAEQPIAPL